jgi:3-deoxy-manno-octulosonate cytidylyltransferase (CMP-KDO synthetase)
VLIATDSQEVVAYADSQGWPSIMTSPQLASGTDRVHAAAAMVDADIYVNIQGDEPLLRREHIDALLRPFALPGAEVTTLSTPCSPRRSMTPTRSKWSRPATAGRSTSRAPPFPTTGASPWPRASISGSTPTARRPCGASPRCRQARSNRAERLEQLRLLENGMSIYVEHTTLDTIGVDTEEDLLAAGAVLQQQYE